MKKLFLLLISVFFFIHANSQTIPAFPLPYFDNFDSLPNYWVKSDTLNQWERGIPNSTNIQSPHSPPNVWATNLDSSYKNNSCDTLLSPKFIISNNNLHWHVSFWHKMNVQSGYDGGYIKIFDNNGIFYDLGFIGDPAAYNWYNQTINGIPMWSYANSSLQVSTYVFDKSNFPNSDTIQICFIFYSDSSVTGDGWAIDDFSLFPLSPFDAGIGDILNPAISTQMGDTIQVEIEIRNYGTQALTSIPVSYNIDSNIFVNEIWTGSLLKNSSTTFTFQTPYIAGSGNCLLCVSTNLLSDSNSFNNDWCKIIYSTPGNYDAEVISIVNPNTKVHTGDTIYVHVKIKNFGTQALSMIPLSYKIGNNLIISDLFTYFIAPNDTVDFIFQQAFIAQSGSNNMCAWTNLSVDVNPLNDSTCIFFISSSVNNIAGNFYENVTSVNNQSIDSEFNFYPNPTSGKINIDLGKPYKTIDVTVKNVMGQEVLSKTYKSSNQLSFEIKGAKGVYFVEVRTDGKSSVFKVVKE